MINVISEHPMIGRDLTLATAGQQPGRAIMQYNATQAYMEGDQVVILQKDLEPLQIPYRDGRFGNRVQVDHKLLEKALAHANWSSMAYEKSLYRLP
jgi:hypothetical protein